MNEPIPDSLDVLFAVAEAVATHPEGTELDADGNPVPPDDAPDDAA